MNLRHFSIFLTYILFLSPQFLVAAHHAGGEISWECQGNGNYRFTVKVYRDCSGPLYPAILTLYSNSPAGNIIMRLAPGNNPNDILDGSLDGITEISPICNPDTQLLHLACSSDTSNPNNPNSGALQEWFFTSDTAYPNGVALNGTPPASGWVFYIIDCCRNTSSNVINSSSIDYILKSVMYPFKNQGNFPCIDNSPQFATPPAAMLCTGYSFLIGDQVTDKDEDMLRFEWTAPLESVNYPITSWQTGYSYTSPLPGTFHNPNNSSAVLDEMTGTIVGKSFTQGAFMYSLKANSYREGIKISEILRDYIAIIHPCDSNLPPVISIDSVPVPDSLHYIDYEATIGDTIAFSLGFLDTIPMTLPNQQVQTIRFEAYGDAFGTGFVSDTSGCVHPPCALLNPPPPLQTAISGSSSFTWTTDSNHLITPDGKAVNDKYYHFHFGLADDYCPVPAKNNLVVRVHLKQPIESPLWNCAAIDSTGNTKLNWSLPPDPDSLFYAYAIAYRSDTNLVFTSIDTIYNYNTTNYTHILPGGMNDTLWYAISTLYIVSGDTLGTIQHIRAANFTRFSVSPAITCPGDTVTVTFSGYANPGAAFNLDPDGGSVSGNNPAGPWLIVFDTSGQYAIRLQVTENTCYSATDTAWVSIQHIQASLSSPSYYCKGVPAVFTASGGVSYQWSTGQSGSSIVIVPNNNGNVSVTVTMANTCTDTLEADVEILTPYDQEEICLVTVLNQRPLLVWVPTSGKFTSEYQIYRQHPSTGASTLAGTVGFIGPAVFVDSSVSPVQVPWKYYLAVVDSCGQVSANSPFHQLMNLVAMKTANQVLLSWFPYTGFSFSHYYIHRRTDGGAFQVIDSVASTKITWTDANPPASGLLEYTVEARRSQPCSTLTGSLSSSFSNIAIPGTPGIGEPDANEGIFLLFPNPAADFVVIQNNQGVHGEMTFCLTDPLGRIVLEKRINNLQAENRVSLSGLPVGIYGYRLFGDTEIVQSGKLIIK